MICTGKVIWLGMDRSVHGDCTVIFERDGDGTIRVVDERWRPARTPIEQPSDYPSDSESDGSDEAS